MKKRADGRWVRVITINGKKISFYSREATEKKAQKDIEHQLLNFKEQEENGPSFFKVAESWNREYRQTISDINYNKSVRAYYNRILNHFSRYQQIKQISHIDLSAFLNDLIYKNYSKKTIASHKSILNMIFRYATVHGFVAYNPMRDIVLPNNLPKKERNFPTTEEIKIVDSNYQGFDLLPYFLLYTGLRRSEALALTYEDIDFENKTITINKHLIHDGNRPVIENKTKTINSARTVVLLDRLAEKLPKKKKGLVFCNSDGSPFTKCQYAKRWAKYQKKYNVTVTAHQLRHAFATMLFEAGIDVKDAQDLMGHSDINLTRQIYTHIRSERKDETKNKLNNFNF